MQGDPKVDELMRPVLAAIKRHVKNSDAVTDIYNRAYEAVINSMDVNAAELAAANEDAERLAAKHTERDRPWGETCIYCHEQDGFMGIDTIKHAADCPITLHRVRVGGAS
jgi:cytochrome c553